MQNRTPESSKARLTLFMLLMLIGIAGTVFFFFRLKETKNKLQANNTKLTVAFDSIHALNDSVIAVKTRLEKAQKDLVALVNGQVKSGIQDSTVYVQVGNAVDSTWSILNPSKFERALQLERKAFEAIRDGHFDKAIDLLHQTEEVYKNFHQVFEIRNYLEDVVKARSTHPISSQPGHLRTDAKSVQAKIVKDFSWKAPQDIVQQIEKNIAK